MKATVNTTDLTKALASVRPAVANQRPFVMLRTEVGLEVAADDMDMAINCSIPAESTNGECLVPYKPLSAFVGKVRAERVAMEVDGGALKLTAGRSKMTLTTVESGWFPQRPEPEADVEAVLEVAEWQRVRSLVPFASQKESMGPLRGVYFDGDGAMAQDTLRLGLVDYGFGFTTLIPTSVIAAVGEPAEAVKVTADDRSVRLTCGGVTIQSSALAGGYPPVRQPLSTFQKVGSISMVTDEFADAVDRASILSREGTAGSKVVLFRIAADSMVVESWPDAAAEASDVITEEVEARVDNVEATFGIHAGHLSPVLDLLGRPEELILTYCGERRPLLLTEGDVTAMLGVIARGS